MTSPKKRAIPSWVRRYLAGKTLSTLETDRGKRGETEMIGTNMVRFKIYYTQNLELFYYANLCYTVRDLIYVNYQHN